MVEVLDHQQDDWDDFERELRRLVDEFSATVHLLGPGGGLQPVSLERVVTERRFRHVVFDLPSKDLLTILPLIGEDQAVPTTSA